MKPSLPIRKTKGLVKLLQVSYYEGAQIFIRRIGVRYFEYLVLFKDKLYTHYFIFTPKPGSSRITKSELSGCIAQVMSGALATIDMLIGKKLPKQALENMEALEKINLKKKSGNGELEQ